MRSGVLELDGPLVIFRARGRDGLVATPNLIDGLAGSHGDQTRTKRGERDGARSSVTQLKGYSNMSSTTEAKIQNIKA